jgi:phosphoribosyl-AMP cyclohydrolase
MAEVKLSWSMLKKRSVDGIKGLILAIAQDYKTGEVLMAAFMNKEAFEKTLKTGKVHYYSTSRKKIWLKGESSGNMQKVKELYVDCDMDALLIKINQKGAACHEGYKSCFYRRNTRKNLKVISKRLSTLSKVCKK